MTPKEVLDMFHTIKNFHKETGMAQMSLWNWLDKGYVPEGSQYKLEKITKGKLKSQWPPVK